MQVSVRNMYIFMFALFIIVIQLIYSSNMYQLSYVSKIAALSVNILVVLIIYNELSRILNKNNNTRADRRSEFISLGSTLDDAIYSRKYRYDIAVDQREKDKPL
jgi:amino acid permease